MAGCYAFSHLHQPLEVALGKYRTRQLFMCPYCNIVGWFKRGDRDAHIKKSHPGKPSINGSGYKEWIERFHASRKEKCRKPV